MKGRALYIHIPFCKSKCKYCDFPSYSGCESYMKDYTNALKSEIQKYKDEQFKTIFIGGGTPTYLSIENWKALGQTIEGLSLGSELEFTVECNPNSITGELLTVLKHIGVNRLSIGLQAWQDELLKILGRVHRREDFLKTYELCREFQFDNINVDVMFGLPGQKLTHYMETLCALTSLGVEHLSCYSLIVEEGTPFYTAFNEGKLILPQEEEERSMYYDGIAYLSKRGYHQYEISNFAKPNRECRHNLVYWNTEDYIGCGAAAHSFYKGIRSSNTVDVREYIELINSKGQAITESHVNTQKDNMEEFMFLGLRKTKGIEEEEFLRRFSVNINSIYGKIINKYVGEGLLKREEGRIFFTNEGISISNLVLSDFIL